MNKYSKKGTYNGGAVYVVNIYCKVHGAVSTYVLLFKTVGKACFCALEANRCHGDKAL